MNDNLGNQDLDDYKDTLGWFFNIKPDERDIIEFIRKTYARIGSVERVLDRKDSKLRVYCDNQDGFVPEDNSDAPPNGSKEFQNKPFKWEQEEISALGWQLACRMNRALGVTQNHAEEIWKRRGNTPSGKLPSDRVVIWICQSEIDLVKNSVTTSQAVKSGDLEPARHASLAMVGTWTALHEVFIPAPSFILWEKELTSSQFVHVNALSKQQYEDNFVRMSLDQGKDWFLTTPSDPKSARLAGYFEPGKIPGHVLNFPYRTVVNPDSYAPLALAWQFRQKQYTMIQQNPYVEDLKWRKDTSLPLGPDPNWSDPNGGWNWSNDPTPDGHA
ncbi:MAG: hypothetical protein Q9160_003937 [Pyrenula sp. 1 TL-2023]